MARATSSTSGSDAKLVLGPLKLSKLGGLGFAGCFSLSWVRTALVWPKGAPLVNALHPALKPPSLVKLMQRWCLLAACFFSASCLGRGGVYCGSSCHNSAASPLASDPDAILSMRCVGLCVTCNPEVGRRAHI
eukprot:7191138-Karenia_brevis.AAC.1